MNPIKICAKPFKLLSPEVAEHFEYFWREVYVAIIHKINLRKASSVFSGKNLKVNLGAGRIKKDGIIGVDFSPDAIIRLDLRRPLPIASGACSVVFSEHFLEHLSYPEGVDQFMADCYRILEPGGLIKLSVPDAEWPLKDYAEGSDRFNQKCIEHSFGYCKRPDITSMERINFVFRQRWKGRSYSHFETHKFAYDFETLKKNLEAAGFTDVILRDFEPDFDSEHRREGSLMVQAKKTT